MKRKKQAEEAAERHSPIAASARAALLKSLKVTIERLENKKC